MIEFLQLILKVDVFINLLADRLGPGLYLLIFLVIFCETGLVVMPFLPGDSLLFAVGAMASTSEYFKIEIYIPLLILASILGDSTNYFIGRKYGRQLFESKHRFSRLFNQKHLKQTEEFYEQRGAITVSISRFLPIIRTVAPFVAGLTCMPYKKFILLSSLGSVVWVCVFTLAGFYFGQIPVIKNNFTLLVMGIVAISLLPMI